MTHSSPICSECKKCVVQGQKKEARQYVKRLLQMGSGSGVLIAAVILLGRGWLPQLFSPDPDVIAAAARALPIVAAAMVRLLINHSCRMRTSDQALREGRAYLY